ncbi:MAG TPA: diguanylate cyclase, partial [Chloroflexota bacterium]
MPNRLNLGRIRHFLTFSSLLGLSDPPIETVSRSPLPLSALRYIAVVAAVILAVVPIAVSGWHGVPSSLLLFLLAVLLCALFAGRRAALVAALVGGIINLLLALASLSAWATTTLVVDIQAAIFVVIALSIIALSEHRRHAQERLQYYTGLTGAITCDPDEAVCAADEFGRVTFANVAVGHILDSPVSELHGKGLHLILHQAAGTRCSGTADSCSFLRMLQPGTTVRTGEEEIFVRQGEQRHISYVSAPIMRGGRAQGVALRFRDVTDRARAVQSLRESEERYRILVETAPDGIILVDLYGFVMMVNGRASRMYGYASPDAMVGVRSMELFEAHDRLRFTETTRRVASREPVGSEEYAALRVDGHSFPIEMRAALLAEEDGDPRAVIYVCRDITEQKRMDQSLHVTEVCAAVQQAASAALAQSLTFGEASLNLVMSICRSAGWDTGMLWMLDDGETVLKCQTVWCRPEVDLAGFEEVSRDLTVAVGHDLPGRVWEIGSPIWIVDVVTDQNFPRALLASKAGLHTAVCLPVQTGGVTRGVLEFFVREPQPENRELVATIVSVCGQFGQFIERKQAEHALQHQARHDALTGLPNRLLLQERVRRALNTASGQDTTAALLLIDLDRFKDVNDTLGHHYGDLLLQHVSQRLSGVLRESDTVARLGGDEFAVLLPASDVVGASLVADKILQVLEQPQYVNGRQIDVGASIGIAVYPLHAE